MANRNGGMLRLIASRHDDDDDDDQCHLSSFDSEAAKLILCGDKNSSMNTTAQYFNNLSSVDEIAITIIAVKVYMPADGMNRPVGDHTLSTSTIRSSISP